MAHDQKWEEERSYPDVKFSRENALRNAGSIDDSSKNVEKCHED